MTIQHSTSPFNSPLPGLSDGSEETIGEQLKMVMYAIAEVKQRITHRSVTAALLVRRLYQIQAATAAVWDEVNDIECRVRRAHADVRWTDALLGYHVGRANNDDDMVHICDMDSDAESLFVCGVPSSFTVDTLNHLHGGVTLCAQCCAEFTRRVFTPGELQLPDAPDDPDGDAEINRRLNNLDRYLTEIFAKQRDDPKHRAAFLNKVQQMWDQQNASGPDPSDNQP